MSPTRLKITYLFHSGFAVETANSYLIFDYYQPPVLEKGIVTGAMLKDKPRVYVFSSHSHKDHFDRAILEWAKANPTITYIFSSDIKKNLGNCNCQRLAPYAEWSDDTVQVKTFGSTDIGVSFLVTVDGIHLFHAGDLNRWHWKEDTEADRALADQAFFAEVQKIEGHPIDVAFFPVDRRLEEYYAHGAEYFAERLRPKLLIPMHFGVDFEATKAFAARAKQLGIATVAITHQEQEITV